jgi:mono/diheme cytochrome c family protein
MFRHTVVVLFALLFSFSVAAQEQKTEPKSSSAASNVVVPVEAARKPNPVKPTPESLADGKKWWGLDCAMCHGKNGNGQGETAKEMKLQIPDFSNPATLKDRSDGELFFIIEKGHQDMPAEGARLKANEYWDVVNYVRFLATEKSEADKPAETKN